MSTKGKNLRSGLTTGTCAAAAAKAAALKLQGLSLDRTISIRLPTEEEVKLSLESVHADGQFARTSVIKDAGDDPDVTNGHEIVVELRKIAGDAIKFRAGEGVGTVTRPGLSVPVGEPAINPVPRRMIRQNLNDVINGGFEVTVSIPGGEVIAERTFNPRLGIVRGLSILGTTGRVVPFSCEAIRETIAIELRMVLSSGVFELVLVPGNIGHRAAEKNFNVASEQIVMVSNEWGFALDRIADKAVKSLLLVGHPGKLAKLSAGYWDTHSRSSPSALPIVVRRARDLFGTEPIGSRLSGETVEGFFSSLSAQDSQKLGTALSEDIANSVNERLTQRFPVAVALINMSGSLLGTSGEVEPWL